MCYSNKQRNIVIWCQFLDRPYNFFSATALASLFSLGGYSVYRGYYMESATYAVIYSRVVYVVTNERGTSE